MIYVPTPPTVVDAMLALAQVGGEDRLYDLGSGDGRIPIAAARRFGTRGVGIDIDPVRIREAEANARAAGVTDLVRFRREDLFEADFSDATTFLDLLRNGSPGNYAGYRNPKFDAAMAAAQKEPDPGKRTALLEGLEQ